MLDSQFPAFSSDLIPIMWKFIDKAKEKYADLPLIDDPRFMYFKCFKGGIHIRITAVLIALLFCTVEMIYVVYDMMESHGIANLVLSLFALFPFGLRKNSRNALLLFLIALGMQLAMESIDLFIHNLIDDYGKFVLQSLRICIGGCLLLIVRNYRRYILELRKLKISERRCIGCKEKLELRKTTETEITDKDVTNKKRNTKTSKKKKNEKIESTETNAGSGGAIARIMSMADKLPFDVKEEFKKAAVVFGKEALSELTGLEETSMLIDLAAAKCTKKKTGKKRLEDKSSQTSPTLEEPSEKSNQSRMNAPQSSFMLALLFGSTVDDAEEQTDSDESDVDVEMEELETKDEEMQDVKGELNEDKCKSE